jgi:tetratricopeptide (TPR) repeat protein
VASFDQSLALAPNDAWAWYHRGLALAYAGETEQAIASVQRALQIDPNLADAQVLLAELQGVAVKLQAMTRYALGAER